MAHAILFFYNTINIQVQSTLLNPQVCNSHFTLECSVEFRHFFPGGVSEATGRRGEDVPLNSLSNFNYRKN